VLVINDTHANSAASLLTPYGQKIHLRRFLLNHE
jgi:hypothetical protein